MNAPRKWSPVALVLALSLGCTTTRGGVGLRSDGTPKPEDCPEDALNTMRILRLRVGDGANVALDINQDDVSPITLYDGPVESMLISSLGPLETTTRLYGRAWTGGPQVVVRYYEAHPPDGDKIPICAVARLSKGQLRKRPDSKPGTAILEFSSAGVDIVESYR
ncbi:serine/threonine protein kinase [Corallococcus carmarthensis]|uniref:Serine/threonine protein kinase n=1 Tax=Corallococcus carmarthensis TaxID=2316728 RepID=A0A3A8JNA7_9BACT|nr:serine/threonine protein kinase [Corallococcus carmarthensis]NOK20058.1 serine/threonine protein kinase [Corallococcus carmarthensis]RKG97257.1 serine/threonine protein kinase [Corallococcus carmarthensis]